GPAHALRTHHDFFPEAEIEAPAFAPVVRESGAQQRGAEAWRRADANRLAVQARALSALGNEAFFFQRVEDYAELHAAAPFVRDRYAELRIAVREVGGAVERIDNPSMVALMRAGAAFLREDRMGWKCAMDHVDDGGFRFAVGFGDQIYRVRLAIDGYSDEPFEMDSAGGTRGAERNLFDFVDHNSGTILLAGRIVQRQTQINRQRAPRLRIYQRGVSARPTPSAALPSNSRARALDSG